MSRSPSVSRRHFLELSPLSPWDRTNSDTSLASPRPARRPFAKECQFRSHLDVNGDDGGQLEFNPEYRAAFSPHPPDACASPRFARGSLPRLLHQQQIRTHTPSSSRKLSSAKEDYYSCDELHRPDTSETREKFGAHENFKRVRTLRRHSTSLHLEGEFTFAPEYASSYVDSPRTVPHKPPPAPRSSLHNQGDFHAETEVSSQYGRRDDSPSARPPLIRHKTELQLLKGTMDGTPEYRSAYVDFPRQRPQARRPEQSLFLTSEQKTPRPNTLRLDTVERPATVLANYATQSFDPDVRPEYQDSFKDFPRSRPTMSRPPMSLTPDGSWFGHSAEYRSNFVDFPRHRPEVRRLINSLRDGGMVSNSVSTKFMATKKQSPSKPSPGLEIDKSPMDTSPEYRESYKNFPRHRPETKKPLCGLRPEGEFYDQNEYKENYKDSPRMRPKVIKPSGSLKPEGDFTCSGEYNESYNKNFPRKRPDLKKAPPGLKLEGELLKTPEYMESYKDSPRQRPLTPRPVDTLKPEGTMEEKPEYQRHFVDHPRQRPDVPRPENNLRPRGPWLGRFPEYRAAFVDLPRQRPVTPRPLSNLNSDALGGGYRPQFNGRPGRASSAGPTGHANQRYW
jgi:hypothetical protein